MITPETDAGMVLYIVVQNTYHMHYKNVCILQNTLSDDLKYKSGQASQAVNTIECEKIFPTVYKKIAIFCPKA